MEQWVLGFEDPHEMGRIREWPTARCYAGPGTDVL